jgi:hypothetical protein
MSSQGIRNERRFPSVVRNDAPAGRLAPGIGSADSASIDAFSGLVRKVVMVLRRAGCLSDASDIDDPAPRTPSKALH